jgi:uncharacterized protein (TIGR03435 family)
MFASPPCRHRVGAILDERQRRGRARPLWVFLAYIGALVIVLWVSPFTLVAAPQETHAAFEVASVKPSLGDERQQSWGFLPGGRYAATSITLKWLLITAYNLSMSGDQLSGAPNWLDSARFDIQAKPEAGTTSPDLPASLREERVRSMLQTLLVDRFKLVFHRESRDIPVYLLIKARNGTRLEKANISEADCARDTDGPDACHGLQAGQTRGLKGKAVEMKDLAEVLSALVHRPVIDRTGVAGLFSIQTGGWAPLDPAAQDGDLADARPTIFEVLQQELGLKLQPGKAPGEVLVIDHVEKPSAN